MMDANLAKIKTIAYRGFLISCNYHCGYCPFHSGKTDLDRDEKALMRFCEKVGELGDNLTIMIAPQGECMMHGYYHRAIAQLCRLGNVHTVGCQTNLSFDVDEFAKAVSGCSHKVSLWCSFHPSQTSMDDFLRQCEKLAEHSISHCAGAVGQPSMIPLLMKLRSSLPVGTYMWINAQKGMNRSYTQGEIGIFTDIDPLFGFELRDFPADADRCTAGRDSLFVTGDGDCFACNLSGVRMGNLYSGGGAYTKGICRAKKCSCYLAYANRREVQGVFADPETIPVRNPFMRHVEQ